MQVTTGGIFHLKRATCNCGYRSRWCWTKTAARKKLVVHIRERDWDTSAD